MPECYSVLSLNGLRSCKFLSRSDLVLISFWMLTIPWIFLEPISFYWCVSRSVFQTKVAHLCFCLVRIKMPLLIYLKTSLCNLPHECPKTSEIAMRLCDWPRPTQGLPGPSGPERRKSPKRVPRAKVPSLVHHIAATQIDAQRRFLATQVISPIS